MKTTASVCSILLGLSLAGYVNADDRFFDSDGVKIRFVDQGPRDGESVVLIHGGFNNIEAQWVEPGVIDALDDVYRVIAMDLRGHGKSGNPEDGIGGPAGRSKT